MDFTAMLSVVMLIGLPPVFYYLYWSLRASKGRLTAKEKPMIAARIKEAYLLSALSILIVPSMLLYFLYVNILFAHPPVFWQTGLVIGIVTFSFEVINLLSYEYYDKERLG